MTWKSITAILVVLVILIAGAWYYWGSSDMSAMSGDMGMATTTTATSTDQGTGTNGSTSGDTVTTATTLRAVASKGGNYTCSLNTISTGSQTRGTLYAAAGKTRLDFVSKDASGTDTTVHIIRSGTTSYTWVDGQQGGVKATITPNSPIVNQPQGGNIIVTDEAQLSSDCHPWVPDTTKFTVPSSIVFVAA